MQECAAALWRISIVKIIAEIYNDIINVLSKKVRRMKRTAENGQLIFLSAEGCSCKLRGFQGEQDAKKILGGTEDGCF